MIKAILFDCFGVIITDALEATIQQLEADKPEARKVITDIIHANNLGMMDPAESNRQIADYLGITPETWRKVIDKGEIKDDRVMTLILQLRKDYKTAMLSNIGRESMDKRFTEDELKTHFDAVIISGDVGMAKPDTAIYVHAANELGVEPSECVFLDDRAGHCEGARMAGMQAIVYKNLAQAKADLFKLLEDDEA